MIPILYEKNETAFSSNGICRLRDCLSCVVTEERNGIYECDFEYPVTGAHYDEIVCGRIIAVTHDDSGDIQPFDIVGYTAPINGVVSFHAVHISYRLNTVAGINTQVTGTHNAQFFLTRFQNFCAAAGPGKQFTFTTNISTTAYCALFAQRNMPYIVRQWMGGTEGSVLDTFHGEWKFDRFQVALLSARGVQRDFQIRYGLNMTEYNDEVDFSGSANSFISFWKGNNYAINSGTVADVLPSYSGRKDYTVYDLTDMFETEPTSAQLETAGRRKMNAEHANNPAETINVSFVRLQDSEEYEQYRILMQCGLCDTVLVKFPMYGVSARMKIVKVVWNVLQERYDSMELGTLATTLSQALGVSSGSSSSSSSGGTGADYVTEQGTSGIWHYRKWNSGIMECWGRYTASIAITTASAGYGGYRSGQLNIPTLPVTYTNTPTVTATSGSTGGYWVNNVTASTTGGQFFLSCGASQAAADRTINFHFIGS